MAKKERKKQKKRNRLLREGQSLPPDLEDVAMADAEAVNGSETQLPSDEALALEEEERREEEERKKSREPPVVYKDALDVSLFSIFFSSTFTLES